MNYQKIYDNIIAKAKSENRIKLRKNREGYVYYDNHHIIPACLNGSDEQSNRQLLTDKEHYVCHKLLTYIYKGNRKLACAFHKMTYSKNGNHIKSSRDYVYAKELMRNTPISEETRQKLSKATKGKSKSLEHRKKIGLKSKGRKHTEESKEKQRKAQTGKKASKETRQKLSNLGKGRKASKKCRAALLKAVTGRKKSKEELIDDKI